MSFQVNKKGFTLIEMNVVIGIIAILIAIGFPNIMKLLPIYQLKGAARTIMTDMQLARGLSASLNREYKIEFDLDSETYDIKKGDKSYDSTSWSIEKTVREIAGDNIDIISVSSSPVVFKPTGTMTATTIHLQNSKGNTIDIKSSIVGRIKTQ